MAVVGLGCGDGAQVAVLQPVAVSLQADGLVVDEAIDHRGGRDRALRVNNKTDQPALIFNKPNCKGWPTRVLRPGQSIAWEPGASVSIK